MIGEDEYDEIFNVVMTSFDTLFEDEPLLLIDELSPFETGYFDVSSLIFLIREMKTKMQHSLPPQF